MEDTSGTRNKALATLATQGALLRRNLRKPISVESRRIALERMITLEFPHFRGFFAEFSSNISMTGMFIKTDREQAVGTLVAFEFSLADGLSLIHGEAEVVWVRREHEGPDRPSGMGLRFVRLDKESRRLIRWAVEKQLQEGGSSFDLDDLPAERRSTFIESEGTDTDSVADIDFLKPGVDGELESRLRSYAGVGVAEAEVDRWRWARYGVVLGLLLAGGLVLAYQWRATDRPVPAGQEPETSTVASEEAEPKGAVPKEAAPRGAIPKTASAEAVPAEAVPAEAVPAEAVPEKTRLEKTATQARRSEVLDLVASWAEAWSTQRVDNYLSFYAESFRPTGHSSLEQWRASRRERILRPARIEVGITDLAVEVLGPERARARFLQSYASDNFRDRTQKVLDLVLEDGQWKIQEERAGA